MALQPHKHRQAIDQAKRRHHRLPQLLAQMNRQWLQEALRLVRSRIDVVQMRNSSRRQLRARYSRVQYLRTVLQYIQAGALNWKDNRLQFRLLLVIEARARLPLLHQLLRVDLVGLIEYLWVHRLHPLQPQLHLPLGLRRL